MRRGRRDREPDGETVVRAIVHARLLGLRLLTLDARVVVNPPDGPVSAFGVEPIVPVRVDRLPSPTSRSRPVAVTGPDLSRAVELLASGAETLERSRRVSAGRQHAQPTV